MAKYILKRLGLAVLSLFAITAIIFILLRQMPIEGYLGAAVEKMSPEAIENALRQMGLLDPIHIQLKTSTSISSMAISVTPWCTVPMSL